jgi:glycosyltransferase involved in cell wall biosynthesis
LFGDWTYEYDIGRHHGRRPDWLERQSIRRENEQIEGSDLVVSLYPAVAKYMRSNFRNPNIQYLGNVINCLNAPDANEILPAKANSTDILFIGGRQYLAGAKCLVQACSLLLSSCPDLRVHIVGLDSNTCGLLPDFARCYGYLDKRIVNDRNLYYALLKRARLIVNTTPNWAGFSAILEAMYFYTPVISSRYDEFIESFGSPIGFGHISEANEPAAIAPLIQEVMGLSTDSYRKLCLNAHKAAQDHTWVAFCDKFLGALPGRGTQSLGT